MVPITTTASDRCKRCYSCVRGCPAKAIRVRDGQAELMCERCVGCGRCAKVCAQGVKRIVDNLPEIRSLLCDGGAVVMVAPSFPAAFPDCRPGQVVAGLRLAGFSGVYEVAFGADLVTREYQKLYNSDPVSLMISTACPAAVSYIEKHAVELLPLLAPLLSPMAAMGKALKSKLRPGCCTVFLGPCTAKSREIGDAQIAPWVDAAMNYADVRRLFEEKGFKLEELNDEEFDPPQSLVGGLYPMAGALIHVADLPSGISQNAVYHVAGRSEFTDLVEKLRQRMAGGNTEELETRFFDVLFCRGCIDGPVMPDEESHVRRKERIVEYLRSRRPFSRSLWDAAVSELADLGLRRSFHADEQVRPVPAEEEIRRVLAMTNKLTPAQELNCGACGYRSCREKAVAVLAGIAEVEMCLPYIIEKFEATIDSLHESHEQLEETQVQLIRTERLASMGQMAAGIAHEVNNPLGTILIFAHLLKDNPDCPAGMKSDIDMILQEATRCRTIVSGLLNFSRQTKVVVRTIALDSLIEGAAGIIRSQANEHPVEIRVEVQPGLPQAAVDREQMHQVLVNLMKNACEAMPSGGTIVVDAGWDRRSNEFRISVRDSGCGIPAENMSKLFSPFFSTKPIGRGTGLGLSICYGIVKMHHGRILARNNDPGPGTTFDVYFPGTSRLEEVLP